MGAGTWNIPAGTRRKPVELRQRSGTVAGEEKPTPRTPSEAEGSPVSGSSPEGECGYLASNQNLRIGRRPSGAGDPLQERPTVRDSTGLRVEEIIPLGCQTWEQIRGPRGARRGQTQEREVKKTMQENRAGARGKPSDRLTSALLRKFLHPASVLPVRPSERERRRMLHW